MLVFSLKGVSERGENENELRWRFEELQNTFFGVSSNRAWMR